MKKLIICLFFIMIMAVSVFSQPNFPEYNGEDITITVWSCVPHLDEVNALFEKEYPNIKIEWLNIETGTVYNKLLITTRAGSGSPDVAQIEYDILPQFIDAGSIRDISNWVGRYENLFPQWAWGTVSSAEEIYGIPQDSGPLVMFYRKDIFDKYGIDVPKTWEEFKISAKKLHELDHNVYITDFELNGFGKFNAYVEAAGGKMFDYQNGVCWLNFTDPVAMKIIKYWGELLDEGIVAASTSWTVDWWNAIKEGKYAVHLSAAWAPPLIKEHCGEENAGNWRVTNLPQWDSKEYRTGNYGGSVFSVTNQSKNPEAAAIYCLWINSHPEAVKILFKGVWPVAKITSEFSSIHEPDPYFGGQKVGEILLEASEHVITLSHGIPGQSFIGSMYQSQCSEAMKGKQSWDNILGNLQNETLKFLKTQGYEVKEGLPKE